ncbi:MAG TPA: protein kinase [Polyangia bacterium]|jgi:serine/threonine protein kinase|nr:protein kinase [Polyangia bacterium]
MEMELACTGCHSPCRPEDRFCSQCGRRDPTKLGDDPTVAGEAPGEPTLPAARRPGSGLRPGSLFARRYRVQRLLGEGGMGRVYSAIDGSIDELVALKVLKDSMASNPEALGLFKQELKLARKVRHRHVVQSFDLGFADGCAYISMEYIDADNLANHLQRKKHLREDEALGILQQVLRGLKAAHDLGIVHRDIKPGNILLNKDGMAFVTDFGVATQATRSAAGAARDAEALGAAADGVVAGTPQFMAPEQFQVGPIGVAADLYACGALLYLMLTGELPYAATSIAALEHAKATAEARPMPESLAVSRSTRELVAQLLRRNAAERPQHAAAVLEHIGLALRAREAPVASEPSDRPVALVIEGDPGVVELCRGTLQGEGYHVLHAHDSDTALRLAFESDPSLILLAAEVQSDLGLNTGRLPAAGSASERLSSLEGLGLCRILRSDEKLKRIPILVTAGEEAPEVRSAFRSAGASDLMVKPFSQVELVSAIRKSKAVAAATSHAPA